MRETYCDFASYVADIGYGTCAKQIDSTHGDADNDEAPYWVLMLVGSRIVHHDLIDGTFTAYRTADVGSDLVTAARIIGLPDHDMLADYDRQFS